MTPDDRSSRRILVGVAALLGAGAVGASPWEGYRLFLRGLLEERAGRPAAAAEMYENVLKRDPEAPAVRAALVEACLAAGRWDAALQTARSLADGFPESVEFQILLGRAYLAAGQSDKAQGAFDRALKLDPANVDALGWATSQTRLTNPAVAAGALEKFLKESGDGEVADAVRDRLAKLLEHEGNAAGAERHWKKILESDPGNVDALLGLAGLYDVR
ncbi:MAG TPA: tetratricopeptide repeat protein, partial [Elusimicrobiota bacterium]|nr:tetratricopeptide repeat protein [Elusimicrobiota bacterium]